MASAPRRVPPPRSQPYAAVPQSPGISAPHAQAASNMPSAPTGPRPPARQTSSRKKLQQNSQVQQARGAIAQGVATGAIGGGYGPYSYHPDTGREYGIQQTSRFAAPPSEMKHGEKPLPPVATTQTLPQYVWDPDLDDSLHNPDPIRDAALDRSFTIFSIRGWLNATALISLLLAIVILFAGYPIIAEYTRHKGYQHGGFNLGGINGTGQVPNFPNMPSLVDSDTPRNVYTRTGSDGRKYNLVFSDEFNTDGRTFYPGDDPFWEAVDLHYWPTGDLEWYDPQAITTENGKLVITLSQKNNHDLDFQSGMLTTWNKMCFTTGYVEVSVSMPGSPEAPGLWPGVWSMGNLGRAGYGATTEGMWPYSYDTCDVGSFPNQTATDGTPAAAATGAPDGTALNMLPGQRLSACSCPGSDHPGPSHNKGRGVPEIDVIETQVDVKVSRGQVSQSAQFAPFNYQYNFVDTAPATTVYDPSITTLNSYRGGPLQQALSAITYIDSSLYNGQAFAPYAYEWWSDPAHRDAGYITWYSNGQRTWTITSASIGPDPVSEVSQRLIPEEPVYLIMNLGMSPSFQKQDFKHLTFPSKLYVDYVRVYQEESVRNGVTCNPPSHPTSDYINKHINAYTNANLTTWEQAGYKFPRNSRFDGC